MAGRHLNVRILIPLVFVTIVLFLVYRDRHTVQDTLSYSTRPLWDKPSDPAVLLPHLHAEGLPSDDLAACQRHGWDKKRAPTPGMDARYLIDAVLFSTELDLLEIRLRELWDVVDQFVVVESTHTLMGEPKVRTGEPSVMLRPTRPDARPRPRRTSPSPRTGSASPPGNPKSPTTNTKVAP